MKILFFSLFVVFGLSACASHEDSAYYDRANTASQKALEQLDKE
ncbi:hypothetical protein [Sulfurimonas sp.]|nr:hypothetical protein [Sulfurimonas sp.]